MNVNSIASTMHSKNDIQRIAAALASAQPPERSLTKFEALEMLMPALKSARARGHTVDSLVQQLEQQGLKVSARAVSRALALAGEKKIKRGRKAKIHEQDFTQPTQPAQFVAVGQQLTVHG